MKTIRISTLILVSAIILQACSKTPTEPEEIKDEIFKLKNELAEMEKAYHNALKDDTLSGANAVVRVRKAHKEKVEHTIRATGIAEADQMAFVSPETNGLIKKIYVREGQYVTAGTLLVSLNSTVLQNSKAELEKALELAEIMFDKQKKLQEKGVGKEIEFLQAKNQKESLEAKLKTLNSQLAMTQIRAPFSGIVDNIEAKQGEMASPGMRLIQMVNLSKISITADIAERYIPAIKEGEKVSVTFEAYPGLEIKTKIARTGNVINPTNRTFEVEVRVNNREKKIKPNMVCELHITDYSGDEILIPSPIVQNDQKGQFVYIAVEENGRYIAGKKYIKTGFTVGSQIVAEEGLDEGDLIITEGANMVSNGIELNIID